MILLFLLLFVLADTKKLPDVQWISTSSIFEISNTDHVLSVAIGDRLSINCPPPNETNYEYSHLYMVSEEEYSHCYLSNPHLIGTCDNSSQQVSISIVFREFTPTPGGMEFKPGRAYFVTTTSNGTKEGIENRSGGLCSTHQMKLKFDIQPKVRHQAGRTHSKQQQSETTPVMYIIHADYNEDSQEIQQDGDSTSSLSRTFAFMIPVIVCLLL